jgi:hypothetical protein
MITINGNFDAISYQKIDLVWINDLLKNLTNCNQHLLLLVSFLAGVLASTSN